FERFRAMDKNKGGASFLYQTTIKGESNIETLFNTIRSSYTEKLSKDEINTMFANIKSSLDEVGIGIGVPIGYLPKTDPKEMFHMYQLAEKQDALVFTHVRETTINSIQEALANAMITGASLHLVHINSMSLGNIELALEM